MASRSGSAASALLIALAAGCGGGGDDTRTGAIDASFGSAGLSVAAAEGIARGTTARAVAGDGLGRVWATGTTAEPGNAIHARLRADGLADGSFGTSGRLLDPASLSTNAGEAPSGRAVFPHADDGALFVSAQYRASCFSGPSCGIAGGFRTVTDAKVLRVDGAGRPVAAYGASGVATVPFEIFLDATSIAPGEVAVLGEVQRLAGQLPAPIVAARLDTVGRRNTAWEANAAGAFDCPGFSPANRLFAKGAATPAGGLVVVQTFHTGVGSSRLCVSRLQPDGRPDPALANPRGTIIDETIAADGLLNLLAVFANADGTAEAVFGFVDNTASPPFSFAVVAFTREGRIDRARFGAGAFARDRRPVALATAALRQADGSYLIAGYPATAAGLASDRPAVARYRADGSLDESFGASGPGFTTLRFEGFAGRLVPAALAAAPRALLVAGAAEPDAPGSPPRFGVARLALP